MAGPGLAPCGSEPCPGPWRGDRSSPSPLPQASRPWRSSGSRRCCPPTASSTSRWRSRRPPTALRRGGCSVTATACSVSDSLRPHPLCLGGVAPGCLSLLGAGPGLGGTREAVGSTGPYRLPSRSRGLAAARGAGGLSRGPGPLQALRPVPAGRAGRPRSSCVVGGRGAGPLLTLWSPQVFPRLASFQACLLSSPSTMLKTWARYGLAGAPGAGGGGSWCGLNPQKSSRGSGGHKSLPQGWPLQRLRGRPPAATGTWWPQHSLARGPITASLPSVAALLSEAARAQWWAVGRSGDEVWALLDRAWPVAA